ncbi:retrotransposon protein, putative, ty1-copia subclass [Tanacetum coccineum]|uniref:Retrotransposon protein, putative, ty1-copia subclass n=1 Tax=Tanacetum coccineum TaxID=301880 RepID=A0ABQ5HLG9_9ASTR
MVKLHGVPVTAFSEDGLSAIATKLGTPLMLDSYTSDMCMQSWGRLSYGRAMIEVRADVELKDNIVAAMPKITREGYYTCNIRVEYEWKPPRCACCKVFGHIQEECPMNLGLGMAKNLKKPSQTPRGVLVGPKVGFKLAKEYRPVAKKPTANTSGIKKKGVEPTKEVSNSNPFDVLNSVVNDEELGTLVDDDGKPLKRVDYPGDHDSDDERDSFGNGDYDEDPYDDDMYEGQDLPDKLQDTCDSLDIRVRGLVECKASASNLKRIQVKDIVKEVEDYLKTYSSAGMDISWYVEGIRWGLRAVRGGNTLTILLPKYEVGKSSEPLAELFTKVWAGCFQEWTCIKYLVCLHRILDTS